MGRRGHLVIVGREKASENTSSTKLFLFWSCFENTSCTKLSLFWSCFWQDGSCQKEENKDGRHATVGRKKASNNSASTPRCFQVTRADIQILYFFIASDLLYALNTLFNLAPSSEQFCVDVLWGTPCDTENMTMRRRQKGSRVPN